MRYTKALMEAKDYRANMDNARQLSKWIAGQTGLDSESLYKERDSAEWLTSAQLKEALDNNTIKKYYQSQQDAFIKAGDVTTPVPVEEYVMFDIMQKALR